MPFQRCPRCERRNEVFAHGSPTTCQFCGTPFRVDLASAPADQRSSPRSLPPVVDGPTEISDSRAFVAVSGERHPTPPERPKAISTPTAESEKGQARPELPGYDCLSLLGKGGMGEVWKARQLSLQRIVAVKILSPTLAVEPDFVRRFERESSALAALSHPHIVQVFDRGSANGHWYFVMEYVEGRSLRDKHLESPLPRSEVCRLVAQVARAVDYAHAKGVIHRDLKPENILVDHQGNAKVADFGLAGMSEVGRSSLTMTAVAMGTAHYMAPEQRKDAKNVDGRADLYSMGVMLYELLTGELPAGRFKTPKEKVAELDPRLDELILKLLDQDPDHRPSRGSEIAELLESMTGAPSPSAPSVQRPATQLLARPSGLRALSGMWRDVGQHRGKQAMLAVAGLMLLAVVFLALSHPKPTQGDAPLAAKVVRQGPRKAIVEFGGGTKDALVTVGGGWESTKRGLVRVASAPDGGRPTRAYVVPVKVDLDDAAVEADLTLDDVSGSREPPSAELALYKDNDEFVGLRLTLGEDASYELFSSTKVKGRAVAKSEPSDVQPNPQPGGSRHLQLFVINGRVTALVDGRQVAQTTVAGLSGELAKAALGCRVGRCVFTDVRLGGKLAP